MSERLLTDDELRAIEARALAVKGKAFVNSFNVNLFKTCAHEDVPSLLADLRTCRDLLRRLAVAMVREGDHYIVDPPALRMLVGEAQRLLEGKQ